MPCVVQGPISVALTMPMDPQARFGGDPTVGCCLLEHLVVALVQVCIHLDEVSEGPVERGFVAQMAGDGDADT